MLYPISDLYLEHYGIAGQKWGVRRYQNKDGTLTPEGKKRYRNDAKPTSFKGMYSLFDNDYDDEDDYDDDYDDDDIYDNHTRNEPPIQTGSRERDEYLERESLGVPQEELDLYRKEQHLSPGSKNIDAHDFNYFLDYLYDEGDFADDDDGNGNHAFANKAFNSRTNNLLNKMKNGIELTDKEMTHLKNNYRTIAYENSNLRKKSDVLLRKESTNTSSNRDKKKLDSIAEKMKNNREALELLDIAEAVNEENRYKKNVQKRLENPDEINYVDPIYRTFKSKAEKSKAEADYLNAVWYGDTNDSRVENEIPHLWYKVTRMSMDGYEGVPRGKEAKKLFDYSEEGRFAPYNSYRVYTPQYENTKKYKDLEKQEAKIRDNSEYKKARDAWLSPSSSDEKELKRLYEAYDKALDKLSKQLEPVNKEQNKIRDAFNKKLLTAVLKDIGFEVNDTNIGLIESIVYWDS